MQIELRRRGVSIVDIKTVPQISLLFVEQEVFGSDFSLTFYERRKREDLFFDERIKKKEEKRKEVRKGFSSPDEKNLSR